jgi:hypothetical protein
MVAGSVEEQTLQLIRLISGFLAVISIAVTSFVILRDAALLAAGDR